MRQRTLVCTADAAARFGAGDRLSAAVLARGHQQRGGRDVPPRFNRRQVAQRGAAAQPLRLHRTHAPRVRLPRLTACSLPMQGLQMPRRCTACTEPRAGSMDRGPACLQVRAHAVQLFTRSVGAHLQSVRTDLLKCVSLCTNEPGRSANTPLTTMCVTALQSSGSRVAAPSRQMRTSSSISALLHPARCTCRPSRNITSSSTGGSAGGVGVPAGAPRRFSQAAGAPYSPAWHSRPAGAAGSHLHKCGRGSCAYRSCRVQPAASPPGRWGRARAGSGVPGTAAPSQRCCRPLPVPCIRSPCTGLHRARERHAPCQSAPALPRERRTPPADSWQRSSGLVRPPPWPRFGAPRGSRSRPAAPPLAGLSAARPRPSAPGQQGGCAGRAAQHAPPRRRSKHLPRRR